MTPSYSPMLDTLIDALRCLPGVGPRSAQRMAFHLLEERYKDGGFKLANILKDALQAIGRCTQCRTYTEETRCKVCANPARDQRLVCVVETPADVLALEQTKFFKGLYFVLMGHLSPLDGIGPAELGLSNLKELIQAKDVSEVILATNPTIEGEATAHYISNLLHPLGISITRIAHGVPMGSELEYIDGNTLLHALKAREAV